MVTNVIDNTDLAVITALEGYGIEDDTDVPGDTTFYDMSFKDSDLNTVDITWNSSFAPGITNYLTGLGIGISSDERVELYTAN